MSTAWLNCLSACRTGRQEHSLSLGSIRSSHRLGEISSDLGKNSRRLGPGAWGSASIRSGDDVQDLGSASACAPACRGAGRCSRADRKVLPSVGRADGVSNQGSAFLSEVSGVDLGRKQRKKKEFDTKHELGVSPSEKQLNGLVLKKVEFLDVP